MLARHGVTTGQAGEVLNDVDLQVVDPFPPSRIGAAALIGWSPSAHSVLLVLAYRDRSGRWVGINGWPLRRGRWHRMYTEGASP